MTRTDGAVLEVRGLTKRFGETVANEGVDLRVRPGQVVGLLGHNGAGKTTLVNQTVGLLRPDAGRIEVAGTDAVAHPPSHGAPWRCSPRSRRRSTGSPRVRRSRTPVGYAGCHQPTRTQRPSDSPRSSRSASGSTGGHSPAAAASPGAFRRLSAFAMAAVAPTPLVVLDEPTNDVDASRRRLLWQAGRRLGGRGAGVLLVAHNVIESERVVDELVVLDRGRVVATGTPTQLHGASDELRLELVLHPDGADPTETWVAPIAVARRVRSKRRVLLTVATGEASQAVAWATQLREADAVESFSLTAATLEDAYLALTAGTAPLEDAGV